ncbi:MAG TPA: SDR family oxidoreductase [Stellaceae bacterium]|nr:SDR family oxidoreductase [Stellaceae bacterium]
MAGPTTGSERVALVTGASAGIGLYTALGLAHAGFHVIMAGRDPARMERARRTVAERSGATQIEPALADFASLAAVRGLAERVLATHDRLDVLVNNAGLITPRFRLSADGYELTVAVNHLAPFLLTNLLLDRLRASAPARIVTVASQAHRGARIDPATLTGREDWSPLKAYGRSKLCNILFTRALARRLDGSGVIASCLHPGVVATAIGDHAGRLAGFGWRLVKPFLVTPEKGAATSLFLATTPDPMPFHGAYVIGRRVAEPDRTALDDELGERLWAESARLVGLTVIRAGRLAW